MQNQGVIATRVQIAAEIEAGLRDVSRAARPDHRRTPETKIGWQRKHVHEGTLRCSNIDVLSVAIAEGLTDDTPTERLLAYPRLLESIIRRHRQPATFDLATAFRREQVAQGAADPLQHDALVTRSEGDLRIAREAMYGHREAADDAIRAIDAELARRADAKANALTRLQPRSA